MNAFHWRWLFELPWSPGEGQGEVGGPGGIKWLGESPPSCSRIPGPSSPGLPLDSMAVHKTTLTTGLPMRPDKTLVQMQCSYTLCSYVSCSFKSALSSTRTLGEASPQFINRTAMPRLIIPIVLRTIRMTDPAESSQIISCCKSNDKN